MKIYTSYFNTSDYPGLYVLREFFIEAGKVTPGKVITTSKTYYDILNALPDGLACLKRSPEDDPNIIETWL